MVTPGWNWMVKKRVSINQRFGGRIERKLEMKKNNTVQVTLEAIPRAKKIDRKETPGS